MLIVEQRTKVFGNRQGESFRPFQAIVPTSGQTTAQGLRGRRCAGFVVKARLDQLRDA